MYAISLKVIKYKNKLFLISKTFIVEMPLQLIQMTRIKQFFFHGITAKTEVKFPLWHQNLVFVLFYKY